MSLLESTEALIQSGYKPRRTVYLAFGDDEENDGHGAEAIVALLKSRHVHPQFVMDEGGYIARGTIPGVSGEVALISIAEKGIVSMRLTVTAPGGHSSRPPRETAIGILSRAVVRLEERQMPATISSVTGQMLDALAPQMPLGERMMARNRWLLEPVLIHSLEQTPDGNALVRTTTAVTMFHAGVKDNVLAAKAEAVVNFRILPGDTLASLRQHVGNAIGDDRVKVTQYGDLAAEASPVSPTDAPGYRTLESMVEEFFPGATVTPNLLVARTDSARYYALTDNVYKFFPMVRNEADMQRIHGINERFAAADYVKAIQFMAQLMRAEAQ